VDSLYYQSDSGCIYSYPLIMHDQTCLIAHALGSRLHYDNLHSHIDASLGLLCALTCRPVLSLLNSCRTSIARQYEPWTLAIRNRGQLVFQKERAVEV